MRPIVLAASSKAAAAAYLRAEAIEPAAVVDRHDLVTLRGDLRRLPTGFDGEPVLVHSLDWAREAMPDLYLLALARSGCSRARLADQRGHPIGSGSASTAAPTEIEVPGTISGLGGAAARGLVGTCQAAAALSGAALRRSRAPATRGAAPPTAVVAVWPGELGSGVGGAVTHAAGILGALRGHGLELLLVASAPPPAALERIADRVEVLPPPARSRRVSKEIDRINANPGLRSAVSRLTGELERPIVYQRHHAFVVGPALAAAGSNVPLVLEWNASEVWVRRHWGQGRQRRLALPLVRGLERRALRLARLVAAVSEPAAEMAIDAGADPARVLVTPNAVDLEQIEAARAGLSDRRPGEPPTVGWIGTFGPWHGAAELVQAAAMLPAGVRVLMIGDGSERERCRRLAESLGVTDRVSMPGLMPHAEALRALAGCAVLASPHVPLETGGRFFGSPTKIFEFMALGRPIVASDLGQIGELFSDGETARLVPPGNTEALAGAIVELLADPARAERLGVAARRLAIAEHGWGQRAGQLLGALAQQPL